MIRIKKGDMCKILSRTEAWSYSAVTEEEVEDWLLHRNDIRYDRGPGRRAMIMTDVMKLPDTRAMLLEPGDMVMILNNPKNYGVGRPLGVVMAMHKDARYMFNIRWEMENLKHIVEETWDD